MPTSAGSESAGARDVNGRVVSLSSWQRLNSRMRGRPRPQPLPIDAPGRVVLVESVDDAVSSSDLLDGVVWDHQRQVVLRHFLSVPVDNADDAVALAALDGYARCPSEGAGYRAPTGAVTAGPGHTMLVLARAQQIDALHLSQERSRMASLGSRHGGIAVGWQILREADPT